MPVIDLSAYKPVPATLGDANQIANGFQAIQNVVNALDNNNFAAGKIFDPTKLMQNGATDKQALLWDAASATWKPANAVGYLVAPQKYVTLIDVVSSNVETDVLQAAGYLIPANTLGATGVARVTLEGDFLNNTGAQQSPVFRIYFGATKIWDSTGNIFGVASSATRRPFRLVLELSNLTTGTQSLAGQIVIGSAGVLTAGLGGSDSLAGTGGNGAFSDLGNTSSIDTTVNQTLRVTYQSGINSATDEIRVRSSLIEFI